MNDQTPFAPRLSQCSGRWQYEDDTVFADVAFEKGALVIYDWYCAIERQGHSRRALRWLNSEEAVVRIHVSQATPEAMAFWVKMFEEGLVHAVTDHQDRLVLDTGSLDITARRVSSDPDCELRHS